MSWVVEYKRKTWKRPWLKTFDTLEAADAFAQLLLNGDRKDLSPLEKVTVAALTDPKDYPV